MPQTNTIIQLTADRFELQGDRFAMQRELVGGRRVVEPSLPGALPGIEPWIDGPSVVPMLRKPRRPKTDRGIISLTLHDGGRVWPRMVG